MPSGSISRRVFESPVNSYLSLIANHSLGSAVRPNVEQHRTPLGARSSISRFAATRPCFTLVQMACAALLVLAPQELWPNPSIERTSSCKPRLPEDAAHVKR